MSPWGKYQTLSVKEKLAALEELDAGVRKNAVSLKYGISKSMLTTIAKAKDKLWDNASQFAPNKKRLMDAVHPRAGKGTCPLAKARTEI